MKKIDVYDLLISEMGYPMEDIDEFTLENHQEEIEFLKKELGIPSDFYKLILFDDNIHDQLSVVCDLIEAGFGESSSKLMLRAHTKGSVKLKSGPYTTLKPIEDWLRMKDYNVVIRKVNE